MFINKLVSHKDMKSSRTVPRLLKSIIRKINPTLRKYGVKKAGIFGSYARREQKKGSDVDILVQPPKGLGFGIGGIKIELEEGLKKKVHLVSYKYIYPPLKRRILKDEIRIL